MNGALLNEPYVVMIRLRLIFSAMIFRRRTTRFSKVDCDRNGLRTS